MFTGEHPIWAFNIFERGFTMKKNFISLAVLTIAFVFCATPAFCQTNYNSNFNPPPPKIQQNNSILHSKQNIPVYSVNHNKNNYRYSKNHHYPSKYAKNNYKYNYKIADNYGKYPYYYNQNTRQYRRTPSLWERIFNL